MDFNGGIAPTALTAIAARNSDVALNLHLDMVSCGLMYFIASISFYLPSLTANERSTRRRLWRLDDRHQATGTTWHVLNELQHETLRKSWSIYNPPPPADALLE